MLVSSRPVSPVRRRPGWSVGPGLRRDDKSKLSSVHIPPVLRFPDLAQHVAHIAGGAQFAADVGGEAQIALGVEPAGLDVGRELAHDLGKLAENRLDVARFEPPFPGHADLRYFPGLPR